MTVNKRVALIMGSDSDWNKVSLCVEVLKSFDVDVETRVISAHRTPKTAIDFAESAIDNNFGVIICAAGMAAHLAGVMAANTTLPVIGIPLSSGAGDGLDALLSTVQMPSGFPVATVAIDGSKNAAYLAISILSVDNPDLRDRIIKFRCDNAAKVLEKDKQIAEKAALL